MQRKLDEAAQLQQELVGRHQAELTRSHQTAKEAMQLMADAQRQRDAWRLEVEAMSAQLAAAQASEKAALDRLSSEVTGPVDQLQTQLAGM